MSKVISEISRVRELMYLNRLLNESIENKYKHLINEATTPIKQFWDELSVALGKKSGHTPEEIRMLNDLMDEYNEIYGTALKYSDGIDDITRRTLSDLFGAGGQLSAEVIYPSYRKWQSKQISNLAQPILSSDRRIFDELSKEPLNPQFMRPDGTLPTTYEMLNLIRVNDNDFYGMILRGDIPFAVVGPITNRFKTLADEIRVSSPQVADWLDELTQQGDEYLSGGRVTSDEFIIQTDEVIDDLKTKVENPVEFVDVPRVEDMYDIDLSDLGRVTGNDPGSLKKQVQDLMMADLEKKCKTDFCNTLIAMWKSDSQTFQNVWDELQSKMAEKIKSLMEKDVLRAIPQKDVDELNILLKKYTEGYGKPITALELEKLTNEIYKKIKGTNVIGMLGGTLPHWRDLKLLTTPEMRKNTLKFLLWGSDVFSGEWTAKGFVTRWMKLALPITSLYTLYDFLQTHQNEDPNKTTFEQFSDSLWNAVKNFGLMGLAPGVRSIIEAARYSVEKDLEEGRFVDKKTLIKYLKKNFGFSEVSITDNILPKVTYNADSEPAYTEIKGAEGEYAVANGKYQITNTRFLGTVFTPYVEFTPEGESKSKEETLKGKKLDNKQIDNVENVLEKSPVIQKAMDKKFLGIGGYVKYNRQEIIDGETTLIFTGRNIDAKNLELLFKYDTWVAAGKPSLDTFDKFSIYCVTEVV